MDYWEAARQAIEAMVAEHHPESSENWSAIEPMSDEKGWGLHLATWSTEARIIVENFEEIIGGEIDVPKTAIVIAGGKPLDEFQAYLAAKAGYVDVAVAYFKARTVLAGWRE
jgi:hypothetical protein